jgi:ketosteroid isomerase-like protein
MRISLRLLACVIAGLGYFPAAHGTPTQTPAGGTEIPLQHCDRLPIVILRADNVDKRFLIDTAATSLLNEKSFPRGQSRTVRIQSWNETTALNAREVSIGELSLGNHILLTVKLPAIDLGAIAKACGGEVDGILGVDLLEQLGVTIDLKRSVARLGIPQPSTSEASLIADMDKAMHSCSEAFNNKDADKLASCFDPDFVLSTPSGELREQRAVGDVVWSLYDYKIESPSVHAAGRGMMLCRRSDNRWYILSMHESPTKSDLKTAGGREW